MFFAILAAMDGGTATVPPTTSTPSVTSTSTGACALGVPSPAASIRVSWTITNPDATLYEAKLYENSILVSTQNTAASMTWDKTITGSVESAQAVSGFWFADWTYRLDVVRKSDSQVMDSKTSTMWGQEYGSCT